LVASVADDATSAVALERLSRGRADVAAREAWLHWIEEAESLAPLADGEWGPRTATTTEASETRAN
jgi:hypothetical protein